MEKLMKISDKRVILNVQHSGIGFAYPRLFIEVTEERYVNFDVTLGAVFKMDKEDFDDWLVDAVELPEAEYAQVLLDCGIDYEKLKVGIAEMGKEEKQNG